MNNYNLKFLLSSVPSSESERPPLGHWHEQSFRCFVINQTEPPSCVVTIDTHNKLYRLPQHLDLKKKLCKLYDCHVLWLTSYGGKISEHIVVWCKKETVLTGFMYKGDDTLVRTFTLCHLFLLRWGAINYLHNQSLRSTGQPNQWMQSPRMLYMHKLTEGSLATNLSSYI